MTIKSWFLVLVFNAATFHFLWLYLWIIYLTWVPGLAKFAILYFCQFFRIVLFHLLLVVASKITLIPHLSFYCDHFEWPEIADIFWPPWELIRFRSSWSQSTDIPHFGAILTSGNKSNLGSWIFFRTHGRNGLKFDMLMYTDHLWNCLYLGPGLWIFLILELFGLSEQVTIEVYRERKGGMTSNWAH